MNSDHSASWGPLLDKDNRNGGAHDIVFVRNGFNGSGRSGLAPFWGGNGYWCQHWRDDNDCDGFTCFWGDYFWIHSAIYTIILFSRHATALLCVLVCAWLLGA